MCIFYLQQKHEILLRADSKDFLSQECNITVYALSNVFLWLKIFKIFLNTFFLTGCNSSIQIYGAQLNNGVTTKNNKDVKNK